METVATILLALGMVLIMLMSIIIILSQYGVLTLPPILRKWGIPILVVGTAIVLAALVMFILMFTL